MFTEGSLPAHSRQRHSKLSGLAAQVEHTDVTLDDLWALDLAKLDGWRCVRANTAGEDAFRDGSSGWEDEGGSAESDSD